jgi:hypothetical protein
LYNSSFEIFQLLYAQTASNTLIKSFFSHAISQDFIAHPVKIIAGKFSLQLAISIQGVILSQFVTHTQPSKLWLSIISSILSAIWSLLGKLSLISAYIAIQSQIQGTHQTNGTHQASFIHFITSAVRIFK